MSHLCQPCQISYHAIAKLETVATDSKQLFDKLSVSEIGDFPDRYDTSRFDYSDYHLQIAKMWQDIPKKDVLSIYKLFYLDFELYGYEIDPFL